jgi:hypothetical protein
MKWKEGILFSVVARLQSREEEKVWPYVPPDSEQRMIDGEGQQQFTPPDRLVHPGTSCLKLFKWTWPYAYLSNLLWSGMGSEGIHPRIFYLGIGWRWECSRSGRFITCETTPGWWVSNRKLVGPLSQYERCEEEEGNRFSCLESNTESSAI